MSWYTKRAIVSKIYVATELFMLQDKSNEHEATWEFLDRRIDNVLAIGKVLNSNQNLATAVQTGLSSIFSIVKPSKFDDSKMRQHQEDLRKKDESGQQTSQDNNG